MGEAWFVRETCQSIRRKRAKLLHTHRPSVGVDQENICLGPMTMSFVPHDREPDVGNIWPTWRNPVNKYDKHFIIWPLLRLFLPFFFKLLSWGLVWLFSHTAYVIDSVLPSYGNYCPKFQAGVCHLGRQSNFTVGARFWVKMPDFILG